MDAKYKVKHNYGLVLININILLELIENVKTNSNFFFGVLVIFVMLLHCAYLLPAIEILNRNYRACSENTQENTPNVSGLLRPFYTQQYAQQVIGMRIDIHQVYVLDLNYYVYHICYVLNQVISISITPLALISYFFTKNVLIYIANF